MHIEILQFECYLDLLGHLNHQISPDFDRCLYFTSLNFSAPTLFLRLIFFSSPLPDTAAMETDIDNKNILTGGSPANERIEEGSNAPENQLGVQASDSS